MRRRGAPHDVNCPLASRSKTRPGEASKYRGTRRPAAKRKGGPAIARPAGGNSKSRSQTRNRPAAEGSRLKTDIGRKKPATASPSVPRLGRTMPRSTQTPPSACCSRARCHPVSPINKPLDGMPGYLSCPHDSNPAAQPNSAGPACIQRTAAAGSGGTTGSTEFPNRSDWEVGKTFQRVRLSRTTEMPLDASSCRNVSGTAAT